MKKEEQNAFPALHLNGHRGMSLRDYFANSVNVKELVDTMTITKIKLIMEVDEIPNDGISNILFWFDLEAKMQFMKADAMLKQREL